MTNKVKGFLALLGCGIIFGSFSIYIRLLSQDLDSYQQILFRNGIAFIIAIILIFILKSKMSLNKVPKKYIFLYAFSFPLTVVLFTLSVLNTKIIVSIFSLYIGSIATSFVAGVFFFKEKVTRLKLISLGLVLIGLLLMVYPSLSVNAINIGFIFGLLSGIIDTIANSFRKYLSGKMDKIFLVAIQMIGGIVVATIFMSFFKSSFSLHISAQTLITGLIFGGSLIVVSYLTLVGFQNFDLNMGTIIISSELFFGPLFAAIVFKEYPNLYEVLGGIFILMAILIPNLDIEKKLLKAKR